MSRSPSQRSRLEAALRAHASEEPEKLALKDSSEFLSYRQLVTEVDLVRTRLESFADGRPIALVADNGLSWAITDLAAHVAGIPIVPIATFFSPEQINHAIDTAGIEHVLTDDPGRFSGLDLPAGTVTSFHRSLTRVDLGTNMNRHRRFPDGVTKVTFTSGTTGQPKGVCLNRDEIELVALSLCAAVRATADDQHVCLLPLATLLENIGGLHVPLLAGATVHVPTLSDVGLTGSSTFDVLAALSTLARCGATTAITVPQMLRAFVAAAKAGVSVPSSMRYVAVGGAPVSMDTLERAIEAGLPVFEGYGLSECASVVAVNQPGAQRAGSVGKPLAHVELCFADDSEIWIRRRGWPGYLGDEDRQPELFATGDLGYQDRDGYLYITGRKKTVFITAFGRNVAPEWLERELLSRSAIVQVAVFGEGRPFNVAVVVAQASATPAEIEAAFIETNAGLPDYARVMGWTRASEPFARTNHLMTDSGTLRREQIFARYEQLLNAFYAIEDEVERQ